MFFETNKQQFYGKNVSISIWGYLPVKIAKFVSNGVFMKATIAMKL